MILDTYDDETVTICLTRKEFSNIRVAVHFVSQFFDTLDREALDGYRMTMEESDKLADDFASLSASLSAA